MKASPMESLVTPTVCAPVEAGHDGYSIGDWLINEGSADITVTGVELVRPKNMSLMGTVVLPDTERPQQLAELGAWYGFPPVVNDSEREYWDRNNRPAVGAIIAPGERVNLIQGLQPTDTASVKGAKVTYTYQGQDLWAQTPTELIVSSDCSR